MRLRYLPIELIITVHDRLISAYGGSYGIRDEAALAAALERPKNSISYGNDDLFQLASLYADGIANGHPFVDGNKRTGFIASYTFLGLNDIQLDASEEEAVTMTVQLAAGEVSQDDYAQWLCRESI